MGPAAAIVIAVFAQSTEPPPAPEPLAGPMVADHTGRTLADRGYDGSIRDLQVPAPEAAVDLLELSEPERERIQTLLAERAAVFDRALADNFEMLQLFPAAEAENDRLAQIGIIYGLIASLDPLRERPPLRDEIRQNLDPENQTAYDAVLARYARDLLASAKAEAERTDSKFSAFDVFLETGGKTVQIEIERAIERRFSDGAAMLESIIARLDLTPEQEVRIGGLVLDFVQEAGLDPTQEQQERFFLRLITHLRPDQAAEFVKIAKGL